MFLFVTQYDDFEDSDGVTSEGEGLFCFAYCIWCVVCYNVSAPTQCSLAWVTLTVVSN